MVLSTFRLNVKFRIGIGASSAMDYQGIPMASGWLVTQMPAYQKPC